MRKILIFILLIIVSKISLGIIIGASPSKLIFNENQTIKQLVVYNPNNFSVKLSYANSKDIIVDSTNNTVTNYDFSRILIKRNITSSNKNNFLKLFFNTNKENEISTGIVIPITFNKKPKVNENYNYTYEIITGNKNIVKESNQNKISIKEKISTKGILITLSTTILGLFIYLTGNFLIKFYTI